MKQNVSPGVIAAIIVVVVLVIGFFAFKFFGGDPASNGMTKEQAKAVQESQSRDVGTSIMGTRDPNATTKTRQVR